MKNKASPRTYANEVVGRISGNSKDGGKRRNGTQQDANQSERRSWQTKKEKKRRRKKKKKKKGKLRLIWRGGCLIWERQEW